LTLSLIRFSTVVVGLGPAGLGFATTYAKQDAGRMLLVERGSDVAARQCTVLQGKGCRKRNPCEIIAGVGGAALLSGGKISDYPAGRGMAPMLLDPSRLPQALEKARHDLGRYVPLVSKSPSAERLQAAHAAYAAKGLQLRHYEAFRYKQSELANGFRSMVSELEAAGHYVWLDSTVTLVTRTASGLQVDIRRGPKTVTVTCDRLVLAAGRAAHRILTAAPSLGVHGTTRRTDAGVRIEFPNVAWPTIDDVHNDLKLEWGQARTYCVCKNGSLAPYWSNGAFLTEGYSDLEMDTGLTNLAIVVRLDRDIFDDVRSRQKSYGPQHPLRQTLREYVADAQPKPAAQPIRTSITHWQWGNINRLFPDDVAAQVRAAVAKLTDAMIPADYHDDVSVFGPELDHYWPTYEVGPGFTSNHPDIHIVGDATGHFRGILQAFCSGQLCAQAVLDGPRAP
jgi:uncharacterized FAD-dependent dehydrogenase